MADKVTFPSNGHECEGVIAGEGPGVILIQEWWGLVDHIVEMTDKLAAEGFTVLAPDLYHGVKTDEPDEAGKLMMGLAMDTAAQDIAGAAEFLVGRGAGPHIGAIGFCMGGSLALWSATLSPKVIATVGFYPAVPWERMKPEWDGYRAKSAIVHGAEGDGGTGNPGITQATKAIEAAGGEVTLYDYPGTQHAWMNDHRPEIFSPDDAPVAWERTVEFLRGRLS